MPYMSWQNGAIIWQGPDDNPGEMWQPRQPQEVFKDHGLHWANVTSIARSATRPYVRALPELEGDLISALWMGAYGLGMVAADLRDDSVPLDRLLATPAARQALATLPGGALRFILDGPRLQKVIGEMTAIVDGAVRRGFDAVRNARRSRGPRTDSRTAEHH
jgi:hypothetical protein